MSLLPLVSPSAFHVSGSVTTLACLTGTDSPIIVCGHKYRTIELFSADSAIRKTSATEETETEEPESDAPTPLFRLSSHASVINRIIPFGTASKSTSSGDSSVSFSIPESFLSASSDKTVRLWSLSPEGDAEDDPESDVSVAASAGPSLSIQSQCFLEGQFALDIVECTSPTSAPTFATSGFEKISIWDVSKSVRSYSITIPDSSNLCWLESLSVIFNGVEAWDLRQKRCCGRIRHQGAGHQGYLGDKITSLTCWSGDESESGSGSESGKERIGIGFGSGRIEMRSPKNWDVVVGVCEGHTRGITRLMAVPETYVDEIVMERKQEEVEGESEGPSRQLLLSSSCDKSVRLFDTDPRHFGEGDGCLLGQPLRGHADYVGDLAWIPVGMRGNEKFGSFVSVSNDGWVRFWRRGVSLEEASLWEEESRTKFPGRVRVKRTPPPLLDDPDDGDFEKLMSPPPDADEEG